MSKKLSYLGTVAVSAVMMVLLAQVFSMEFCVGQENICTDSDGGKNYYMKGIVIKGGEIKTDQCIDIQTDYPVQEIMTEYYCENNEIKSEDYICPKNNHEGGGCEDGACVFDSTADWQTYRNEKYGFEVKVPDYWPDFNAKENVFSDAECRIDFNFLTNCVNCVTDNGYMRVFGLMIINKDQYNEDDYSNSVVFRQNSKYVFFKAHPHDTASDLMDVFEESEMLFSTFKFIDEDDNKTPLPPAGYEDNVITNSEDYQNPFPDTAINSLEGKAASELYRRAVIGGFPDGEFKGDRSVNRAEASKFLLLARGIEVGDLKNNGKFHDVKSGEWYEKFVMEAAERGIISGHPDGTFQPAATVNTAEFLKMLTKTFGLAENLNHNFADVKSSDWFAPFAGTAKEYNLFPNRDSTKLEPARNLTRDEVAVAIYQFLKNR